MAKIKFFQWNEVDMLNNVFVAYTIVSSGEEGDGMNKKIPTHDYLDFNRYFKNVPHKDREICDRKI